MWLNGLMTLFQPISHRRHCQNILRTSSDSGSIDKELFNLCAESDSDKMRALTEAETQTLFSKLANYTGRSLTNLIAPPASADGSTDEDRYVFRLHESRVYYVRLSL